jgi:chromosome partitioning protein
MQAGAKVATIDIDPQGSLTLWYAARMAALGARNKLVHSQTQGWRLKKEVERLSREADFVIIDSPPHAESDAAIAIRAADIVLIPVQPSPLDLWACRPTLQTVKAEKSDALFVLNRVPPRAKLTDQIKEKMQELDVKALTQTLGSRVAFAQAMTQGRGAIETEPASDPASEEVAALVKEIRRVLSKGLKAAA